MTGRVILVHWNAAEAEELARPLRSEGWAVEVESQDGARACRLIRETAHTLKSIKAMRDLLIRSWKAFLRDLPKPADLIEAT